MKELVVISGKGGTGKTSIVASFATLAENAVLADCDVDAADLHLVLDPTIVKRETFSGGSRARIMPERCTACGKCAEVCRFDAVSCRDAGEGKREKVYRIDPIACEGCGVCAWFCPEEAIEFAPAVNGEWFVSDTRAGPMVHAKLGVAEENSGKLVSLVREQARETARTRERDLVLIDGSPGIGCPVIASIVGADLVLVVTEPTLSGRHDLERVSDLTRYFRVETLICINKWDINEQLTLDIEALARRRGLAVAGRVRYDRAITEAQIKRQSVTEYTPDGSAADVRLLWEAVLGTLSGPKATAPAARGDESPAVT
ncbi:MAG: ATP-binding protein [Planctomycetes bacterium]|nr:ATP-binding protein [Planctomycetota bacterium]